MDNVTWQSENIRRARADKNKRITEFVVEMSSRQELDEFAQNESLSLPATVNQSTLKTIFSVKRVVDNEDTNRVE